MIAAVGFVAMTSVVGVFGAEMGNTSATWLAMRLRPGVGGGKAAPVPEGEILRSRSE